MASKPKPKMSGFRAQAINGKTETINTDNTVQTVQPVKDKPFDVIEKTPVQKPKVKRDTFTFPENEHQAIESITKKLARKGRILNKSEIMRLGLLALKQLDDKDLAELSDSLDRVKQGRR